LRETVDEENRPSRLGEGFGALSHHAELGDARHHDVLHQTNSAPTVDVLLDVIGTKNHAGSIPRFAPAFANVERCGSP
jgi:hypothetical protein